MTEWIAIEDRKPSEQDIVLVARFRPKGVPTTAGRFVTTCMYTHEYGFALNRVTHWMPMPEPPTVEGEQ